MLFSWSGERGAMPYDPKFSKLNDVRGGERA